MQTVPPTEEEAVDILSTAWSRLLGAATVACPRVAVRRLAVTRRC